MVCSGSMEQYSEFGGGFEVEDSAAVERSATPKKAAVTNVAERLILPPPHPENNIGNDSVSILGFIVENVGTWVYQTGRAV